MTEPKTDLSPAADAIRSEERAAIRRLAAQVAAQAARAAGYRDAAEVSVNFIDMVLTEAFAARDVELDQLRRGVGDSGDRV
jgi:hypothetical protein